VTRLALSTIAFLLAGSAFAADPAAPAPPADAPAKAAVEFLDAVRSRKITSKDLESTAITRFTGEKKREELGRRIDALASTIAPKLPFVVETTKTSGNLAGAVVSQYASNNPSGPRLFAVALVRRDDRWLPAPSPGSFENTLHGYDRDQSRRAAEIESWLLHERATRTASIRERKFDELRKRMLARVPPGELAKLTPETVVHRFVAACVARDLDAALAMVGGIRKSLPDDWELRHRALFQALNDTPDPLDRPWRLLAGPHVARATLAVKRQTRNSTSILLGCLDPSATNPAAHASGSPIPPIVVPLDLVRDADGPWRIDLPKFLLEEPRKRAHRFDSNWLGKLINGMDPEMIERFPEAFRKGHPPVTAPDPAALRKLFLEALEAGDYPEMLRLAASPPDPAVSLIGYGRLATIWNSIHGNNRIGTTVLLGTLDDPATTAIAFHLFTAQQPEKAHVKIARTVRNPDGSWSLAPAVLDLKGWPPRETGEEDPKESPAPADPLAERIAESLSKWQAAAPAASIAGAERLDGPPATPPPTPDQAASAVREWREALMGGDIPAAIRTAAIFNFKKSTSLFLRALGQEAIGMDRARDPGKVAAAGTLGHWTAVTLRVEGLDGPTFPFYVVVSGAGPARVLPEIDLFQNGTRTRRFLNKSTWRKLREEWPWPKETLDELQQLFDRQKAALAQPPPPSTDDPDKS